MEKPAPGTPDIEQSAGFGVAKHNIQLSLSPLHKVHEGFREYVRPRFWSRDRGAALGPITIRVILLKRLRLRDGMRKNVSTLPATVDIGGSNQFTIDRITQPPN